jgi:hypothetical protein
MRLPPEQTPVRRMRVGRLLPPSSARAGAPLPPPRCTGAWKPRPNAAQSRTSPSYLLCAALGRGNHDLTQPSREPARSFSPSLHWGVRDAGTHPTQGVSSDRAGARRAQDPGWGFVTDFAARALDYSIGPLITRSARTTSASSCSWCVRTLPDRAPRYN